MTKPTLFHHGHHCHCQTCIPSPKEPLSEWMKVKDEVKRFNSKVDSVKEEFTTKVDVVNQEFEEIKKDAAIIKEKSDSIEFINAEEVNKEIDNLTTQLAETVKEVNGVKPTNGKVTIPVPEVDTSKLATKQELQNIGSASPKGTYPTLTALQSAFPTGTTGIYIVVEDGKWYFWNGTAWASGGQYQSTGIADSSIGIEKQNFINTSISNNLFKGNYNSDWVGSDTGNYSHQANTKAAVIPIEPNKIYDIATEGTHDRFTVSFLNSLDYGTGVAKIRHFNNSTQGNERLTIANTDYKFLVIGVSASNQTPPLSVVCKNDKVYLDEYFEEEVSRHYSKIWINYTNGQITPVSVERAIIYPISDNSEITIRTIGTHDRFVVALANGRSGTAKVVYTSKNDGTSDGNETHTLSNTNYSYLIIGMSSAGTKPNVYIRQRFRNKTELTSRKEITPIAENTPISTGIEKTKDTYPVMFGVKMSNERDKTRGYSETPRPVGWLYYTPEAPYKLLYANGAPENMKYLCDWKSEFTWDGKSTPEQYRPFITKDGDIIFVWRGDSLGLGTGIPNVRQNPIVYPAGDYNNPVVVDLGTGIKPTAWLQNCGADFLYNKDVFLFSEYTRPSHLSAYVWKVTKPFTNPTNWKIVKEFPLSGDNQTGMKHCHTINYDPFSDKVFLTTGDDDAASKVFMSGDYGDTWTVVLEGQRRYARVLNFIFTKDKIYWANDDSVHGFYSINRDINGVPDFTNITTLYDLNGHPPTYVNCLIDDPNGILLLHRFDGESTGPLSVHFWDIKTGTMHVIKEIYPTGGTAKLFGFRVEAANFYQTKNDNKIVVGFANPQNNMDLLGNTTYASNKDRINNLVLQVVKNSAGKFELLVSAIDDRS